MPIRLRSVPTSPLSSFDGLALSVRGSVGVTDSVRIMVRVSKMLGSDYD